jgi:FkbM family methyltransferase
MTLKERIKNMPIVGNIAQKAYSRVKGTYRKNPSYWLPKILRQKEAIVVQIGSNDGKTGDPLRDLLLRRKNWSALFVEPVPFLFDRLKNNYSGDPRFSFENSVINDGANVTFYWVAEEAENAIQGLPSWYDQLGGFNRSHITKYIPELEPFIEQTDLPGITLDSLFEKHGIENLTFLHIDTEGTDFKILSQLDLSKYHPEVILYERKHLSKEEEKESILFLQSSYTLYDLGADMLAIEKGANQAAQATLHPLRDLSVPTL